MPTCLTKEQRLEMLLRDLQSEAERGNAEQRLRGRLILRGVRAGLFAASARPNVAEMAELLREELFGQQPCCTPTTEEGNHD